MSAEDLHELFTLIIPCDTTWYGNQKRFCKYDFVYKIGAYTQITGFLIMTHYKLHNLEEILSDRQ